MDLDRLQAAETLHMRQRVTFMVNRYELRLDDGSGREGDLVAFAQQKRVSFKEQVTFYADQDKQRALASFRARNVVDLAAGYDVTDADGAPLGVFRKRFGKSLLRSTWDLEQPGSVAAKGQERSMAVALLRRLWEIVPFVENIPFMIPYHFDFTAEDGAGFAVTKKFALRDRYVIKIDDPRLDRRLVIAQDVALDALQGR